jgi:hypothetical protein
MSELLQQAIIDATALKEAAIKNAENTLIEKYSHEFKSTVQRLLEQEEVAAAPAAAPVPPPASPDASAQQMPQQDPMNAQAAPEMQSPLQDPSGVEQQNAEDPLSKILPAFADADDDELITIDFSDIKKTLNEMMGVHEELEERYAAGNYETNKYGGNPNVVEEELIDENDGDGGEGGDPMEEELELEELELEELTLDEEVLEEEGEAGANTGEEAAKNAQEELADEEKRKKAEEIAKLKQAQARKKAAQETVKGEEAAVTAATAAIKEDIEISEEELLSLAEELRIDINVDGQARGYMGSTTTEKRLQRDTELAAARDELNTEAREQEKEKMADLVKENKQLKAINDEILTILDTLKEHVEKMNLSNAKLLYTNKALVNISLNERQKNHIVESISKAGSVLEAKTVYETLQSTVESVKKEEKTPKSLSEALNRAQSPFVAKKTPTNSISDMQAQRMKLLAGIKPTK